MAKGGRKYNPEPSKAWKIHLPASVAGAVEFQLMSPITGKPTYGTRGALIEALLRKWLSEQRIEAVVDAPATDPSITRMLTS